MRTASRGCPCLMLSDVTCGAAGGVDVEPDVAALGDPPAGSPEPDVRTDGGVTVPVVAIFGTIAFPGATFGTIGLPVSATCLRLIAARTCSCACARCVAAVFERWISAAASCMFAGGCCTVTVPEMTARGAAIGDTGL